MKAQLTIDTELVKLLGRKLYSGHPLPIIVRELLQNSVDACKGTGRRTSIEIVIEHAEQDGKSGVLVTCADNGCGMTEEVLVGKLLCLGASGKNGKNGSVGGFGIAKAAIMSGENWSVHTHDLYIDRELVSAEGEVNRRKWINGTTVTVFITEPVNGWDVDRALRMIYMSDVDVSLAVDLQQRSLLDEHAGLHHTLATVVGGDAWSGSLTPKIADAEHGLEFRGLNVVRMKGLVQYVQESYGGRETNCIVDVNDNGVPPKDPAYPFNMSREGLAEGLRYAVSNFFESQSKNATSSKMTAERPKSTIQIIAGRLVSGLHNAKELRDEIRERYNQGEFTWEMFNQFIKLLDAGMPVTLPNEQTERDENDLNVQTLYDDYKPENWHNERKVLAAWVEVLKLVASSDEKFGVGAFSHRYAQAERREQNGDVYYLIQPSLFLEHNLRGRAAVLALYHSATHEVAHGRCQDHDESFILEQDRIQNETSDAILDNLSRIAKLLPK